MAILVSLSAGFAYVNHRFLRLPASIGILAVALAIPISLAGATLSVRQWLSPVIELGDQESVVSVLLHPRLDQAQRQRWLEDQAH